jgi:hypothetical protein
MYLNFCTGRGNDEPGTPTALTHTEHQEYRVAYNGRECTLRMQLGGRVDINRDHLLVCEQYESFLYCGGMHDCSLKRYKIKAGKSYSLYLPIVEGFRGV